MVDEKYRWIYSYTMACSRGNLTLFQRIVESKKFGAFFKGDFSRKNVRDYFMGPHNVETLNGISMPNLPNEFRFFHLAIPYKIKERADTQLFCELYGLELPIRKRRVFGSCELGSAIQRGVLEREDEIVIAHAGIIAESCKMDNVAVYLEQLKLLEAA